MALRLGKKKDADTTVVTDADGNTAVVTEPTTTALPSEDQFADLIPDNLPTKRRGPSPAILGGAALALVAAAVGAWWLFGRQTVEETETIPAPATTRVAVKPAPSAPAMSATPAMGAKPPTTPVAKATAVVKTVKVAGGRPMSRPEKAGIVPPKVAPGKPAIAAPKPGGVPRFVPVRGVPTPVPLIRPGMAGKAGRRADRRQVLVVTPNIAAQGGALQAQLDALWKAGAAAKHRGDNAAARNQWQRILELDPGHAGIQEAINKLPS